MKKKIAIVIFWCICGLIGLFFGIDNSNLFVEINPFISVLILTIAVVIVFLFFYFIYAIFVIIHELGHLIGGLLSGYKFSSFRIFNLMLIKENNKFKIKRFSLDGTIGQCLMDPPDFVDGKIPVVLYNLGGVIINVIFGIISLCLSYAFKNIFILDLFLEFFGILCLFGAISNGIPRKSKLNNDGYNTLLLRNNKDAMMSFWIQLKCNDLSLKGIRLKDMPNEMFIIPKDIDRHNSISTTRLVNLSNRLMDQHKFKEASKMIDELLNGDNDISDVYRYLLICDSIYLELIGKSRLDVIESYFSDDLRDFMNAMKRFPSVIRTRYTYFLLGAKNLERADFYEKQFIKCTKNYPNKADIEAERELIEIAKNKAKK